MKTRWIEYLIGILGTGLIAMGLLLYILNEPGRITTAQAAQLSADIDEAMTLYAENCAICHGIAGEGIASIPALDNSGLGETDFDTLSKIISRGLYNTAMPAWSKSDGGPLSDYQISELVILIQMGDWQLVQDRVVNLGLAPQIPFSSEPDPDIIAALQAEAGGDILALGIGVYAEQCVACHGPDGLGTSLAPALNDPAVQTTPPDELERIILQGVPGTLMAGWENALTEEELEAVITLLSNWERVPEGAIPEPDRLIPVTAESLALGADLYAASCSTCHGPDGQGTQRAPALNVKGFLEETNDTAMQQIITLGVPGTHMPAWGDRLTEAEIQAVVGYIRAWEPDAPVVAEPARSGGGPWWRTQTGTGPTNQVGGSGGQGPAWQRNNELQAPASQLPSGGQGRGNGGGQGNQGGGPPDWAGQGNGAGHNQTGVSSITPTQAAVLTEPGTGLTDSAPTLQNEVSLEADTGTGSEIKNLQDGALPAQAVDGSIEEPVAQDGTGTPDTPASASASGSGHDAGIDGNAQADHTPGSGPPWAQTETRLAWWQELDERALVLLGAVAGGALSLVLAAFFGLRQLSNATG